MWERLRSAMLGRRAIPSAPCLAGSGRACRSSANALAGDARLQALVNRFARRTVVGMATRYGDGIVRLVSETVRRWDAQTVTNRIEGAVGRDLQFIRVNGTLVGGLVGLAIHAVSRLL